MLMRQIEADLSAPMPAQAPPVAPFDAEQYFAKGGPVHMAGGGPATTKETKLKQSIARLKKYV
jgi:hypothetical protein